MPSKWKIRKWDGLDIVHEWSASGALTEPEICTMLQRLVSQNLSEAEIIEASLRKNDPKFMPRLERIGRGNPINYGWGIHNYTAEFEGN